MKTPVHEANSLEALLISVGKSFKEKKDKYLKAILLVLVMIAVFSFSRNYFYGKPARFQQEFGQAHLLSTQHAMVSGVADPKPFDAIAVRYPKGNDGAEIRINAAEAVLKTGESEVEQKKSAGKAGKATAAVKEMNPEATFNDAVKRFESVTNTQMASDPLLAARALFGLASAWENLASVTAGADEVNVKLDTAKEIYQKVADQYSETPFAVTAKERIASLDEPVVREYYKKIADAYVTMPEPELEAEPESILSEDGAKLDPEAPVSGEDFSLQGEETADAEQPEAASDSSEAEESESAPAESESAETPPVPAE